MEQQKAICNEILSQFAGGRGASHFRLMVGVKEVYFLPCSKNVLGGVSFTLKPCDFNDSKINQVRVYLTPADVYDVVFLARNKVVKEHKGVYCDQLSDLFYEATNLYPYLGYSP